MTKSAIGVLGVGEVGSAIAAVFANNFIVFKKDLNFDEIKNTQIKVLHVCLPYSNKFERFVTDQVKKNKPKLIIIHSTVKPGTTESIFKKSKIPTVHSPVMGTHPNLVKDILRFKKIIGPTSKESAKIATFHFKSVGIKTELFNSSIESETAKLLDTSYYGWNIVFAKLAWELCQKSNVDFNNVYTHFNKIYNSGYSKSKPNVIRPILKYQPGPIGGHCVIPNLELLEEYDKNPISKFILKINNKLT